MENLDNRVLLAISKAPQRNRKMLLDMVNTPKEELFKWCLLDQKKFNKKFKGNYTRFLLSLIKFWKDAIEEDCYC